MARYIIKRKLYDTRKSEKIGRFRRKFYGDYTWITIYKTHKGNYFMVGKDGDAHDQTKEFIGDILLEQGDRNAIKVYEKLFGRLEEA